MPAGNMNNMAAAFRRLYDDEFEQIFYDNKPFWAMLPKETNWTNGYRLQVPIFYGQVTGVSNDFEAADANRNPSLVSEMTITSNDVYGVWSVDHKAVAHSSGGQALVNIYKDQWESAMRVVARRVAYQIWGNGGGSIGQLTSTQSLVATSVVLNDIRDARKFEVGQKVRASTDSGDPTAVQAGVKDGFLIVSGVDTDTGTITFSTALNAGIAGIAVSDYLFPDGDYGKALYGLPAYIPTAVVPNPIWGMARTAHRRRLAGIRVPAKNLQIEEAVKKGMVQGVNEGSGFTHCFMNPDEFFELEMSQQGSRRYVDTKVGTVGFSGLEFVSAGAKPISVFPDPEIKKGNIYLSKLSDLKFKSAGKFPDFLTENGRPYDTEPNANAFKGRIGGYGQLYARNPICHAVIDRTAST